MECFTNLLYSFHMSFRERTRRKCLERVRAFGLNWIRLAVFYDETAHCCIHVAIIGCVASCFTFQPGLAFTSFSENISGGTSSRRISKNLNLKSWQSSCLTYYQKVCQHKLNGINGNGNSFSQQGLLLWYNMAFGHMAVSLSIQEVYCSLFYCNSAVKETIVILLMLKHLHYGFWIFFFSKINVINLVLDQYKTNSYWWKQ